MPETHRNDCRCIVPTDDLGGNRAGCSCSPTLCESVPADPPVRVREQDADREKDPGAHGSGDENVQPILVVIVEHPGAASGNHAAFSRGAS